MKRNVIKILFFAACLLGIIYALVPSDNGTEGVTEQSIQPDELPTEDVTVTALKKNRGESSRSTNEALRILRQRQKYHGEQVPEDPFDDEEVIVLSAEQADEFRAVSKKTSEYEGELAPIVLEEMIQEQQENPQWKAHIETTVAKILDQDVFRKSRVSDMYCGTSLCKISFEFDKKETYENFRKQWVMNGPPSGEGFGKIDKWEEEKIAVSVYFTREKDLDTFHEMRKRMLPTIEKRKSL